MHITRQILDIKLPSSTCWDGSPTPQHVVSINKTPSSQETKPKTRREKARRESVKSQQQMTLMLNFLEAGQPALHAFISYLLLRILLRQCVHASARDDCCAIVARAAVDSMSGIQISTRTWPTPQRCMMGETEMFDANCHIAPLASTT